MVMFFIGNDVAYIACGRYNTCAITKTGKVFTWGSNSNGQLAIDPKTKFSAWPNMVEGLKHESKTCPRSVMRLVALH